MITKQPCIIDVSHWDPIPLSWMNDDLNSYVVGCYSKLTQGTWYEDKSAQQNYEVCKRLGIPFSVYHFFEPNDVARQVEQFIKFCILIGIFKDGVWLSKLPPCLDLEYEPRSETSIVGKELANQVKVWMDLVEQITGVRPILYSSVNYIYFCYSPIYWTNIAPKGKPPKFAWIKVSSSLPPSWAGEYGGWFAEYPDNPDLQEIPDEIPEGWDWNINVLYWQYTDDGSIQGLASKIDLNKFSRDIEKWKEYSGWTGVIPDPPPQGETMRAKTTTNLNLRKTPAGEYILTMPLGTVVEVTKIVLAPNGDPWAELTVPQAGYCSNAFLVYDVTPPPPPEELPVLHFTTTATGYEVKAFDLNPLP